MKLPRNNRELRIYCKKVVAWAAIASLTITPAASFSIPQGGMVSAGTASISTSGNTLTVNQLTPKAVIDWQGFDVGESEGAVFHQPDNGIALNRIHDINPSKIEGSLTANGQVMLVNPNGVVFGKNSKVDVGGMVASTADISDKDFMDGNYRFNKAGNPNGRIVNYGTITAKPGGGVALVAPGVENRGTINAKLGKVQIGGADSFTIDTNGDGLIQYDVTDSLKDHFVNHSGSINAEGGIVSLTATAADSIMDSSINLAGSIDASGDKGGTVQVLGDTVKLNAGTKLNASGVHSGGTILVGGDYQGGGKLPHARNVLMDKDASIDVSAKDKGNGGKVVLWSNQQTKFAGSIKAKGGKNGGNGGIVETSSKKLLTSTGSVDASAAKGNAGTWLLDPNDITIQTAGVDTNISGGPLFLSTDDAAIVTTGSIEAALNGGTSVTIQTTSSGANTQGGDIAVVNNITKTAGGDASLTLKSARDIIIAGGAQITSSSGKLGIVLNSDSDADGVGSIYLTAGSLLGSNGGDIVLGGGLDPLTGYAVGDPAFWWREYGITLNNATLSAGGGNISMLGKSSGNPGSTGYGILSQNSVIQTNGNGTIRAIGVLADGQMMGTAFIARNSTFAATSGDITLTGTSGATSFASGTGLDINGGSIVNTSGNININGTSSTGEGFGGGIYLAGDWGSGLTLLVQNQNGNINVNGAGGVGLRAGYGIWMDGGTLLETTGTGNITVTGTASATAPVSETGIYMQDGYFTGGATAQMRVHNGSLSITGTSAGTDPFDAGINLGGGVVLDSTGLGTITLTGIGQPGQRGMDFNNFNGNVGTNFIGSGATTANINLRANTLDISTIDGIQTTGIVSIAPITASTSIGVAGAVGSLSITTTLLNAITASTISIGSLSGSGVVNLGAYSWNHSAEILSGAGQINVNGAQTAGANSFTARTNNADILLNDTISSSAAGNNIVLAASNHFINNLGAAALNSTVGRWLIYSTDPNTSTMNGLLTNFVQYSKTYVGNPPATIGAIGNGVLWSSADPAAITPGPSGTLAGSGSVIVAPADPVSGPNPAGPSSPFAPSNAQVALPSTPIVPETVVSVIMGTVQNSVTTVESLEPVIEVKPSPNSIAEGRESPSSKENPRESHDSKSGRTTICLGGRGPSTNRSCTTLGTIGVVVRY